MATTRRTFLGTGAAAVSVLGHGCAGSSRNIYPDLPQPPSESTVAVVRSAAFSSHRDAVREAVRLSGGLGFIQPGQRVLLKPAVNSGNAYPATVDPETILVVGQLVRDRGGEPVIADRSMFLTNTWDNFESTGITDAASQLDAALLALDWRGTVLVHHPLADHWFGNTIPVYRDVVEADHIINLCTPRTHSIGDITMSLKNNVGVVDGPARTAMHTGRGFKARLAEISLVVRASFIVMDGRDGFTNGGPDDGDLAHPGFIAAGTDPVALDAVGTAFLRLQGANDTLRNTRPWDLPMMKRAAELGLGVSSVGALRLLGMDAPTEAAVRAELA